jgi:hypothetical protein
MITMLVFDSSLQLLTDDNSIDKITEASLMSSFRVNCVGPVLLAQAMLPLIRASARKVLYISCSIVPMRFNLHLT